VTATCQSEPVSFLRLERYLLGELAAAEHADVQAHLARCQVCRACYDELCASDAVLPALPSSANVVRHARPAAKPLQLMAAFGATLAVAAAVALVVRPRSHDHAPHAATPHTATKGGDLSLSLVRERGGELARDPDSFLQGDRFAASLTCPPSAHPLHWVLYVEQAGKRYFPLPSPRPLTCGNHVALPGAFTLDGSQPATVCVVVDSRAPIDRSLLTGSARVCSVLRPAGG
jgi:Putative zinc-finger